MNETALAEKTIKNSILNITSFVVGFVVNFYLLRFVVASIGLDNYGISALLFVVIAPLNLTNLGFGEATTKYVAEYVHQGQLQRAGAFVSTTFFMNLIIGLAGGLVIFVLGGDAVMWAFHAQIPIDKAQLISDCMKVIAMGWVFNQCSATFMGISVAMQAFTKVAAGNLLYVLFNALFTFLFLYNDWGLFGYTLATVVSQFIAMIFWYITAQKMLPQIPIVPKLNKEAWKQSFHYGGWQTIAQIGGILAQQAEKYVMGVLLSLASVGIYNAVLNIEQKIYMLVHKLSEVLFPMFSSISNDSPERKGNILIKSTWITTTVAVSLLVSVIPFAHPLILLWMKNQQVADQGTWVLQIICLGGAFGSATTAGYFFLLGVGKTQKITYISLLTGTVTVIVTLIALPRYGLAGAGWSALIAATVQSLAIVRVMYTALKGTIPLSAILTAVFAPIVGGMIIAFVVRSLVGMFTIEWNWITLGMAYAGMLVITASGILLVTRFLPHGKGHEELLVKLVGRLQNKFSKI